MNLSNYSDKRNRFFSSLESVGTLSIIGDDLNIPMTLKVKDIKSFVNYCSSVLVREPLIRESIELMAFGTRIADERLSFDEFQNTTKLNAKLTFYFQATTFANKAPLNFRDKGLLGGNNVYKPFDSQDEGVVNTMLTASLEEIKVFSDTYFKLKHFKGVASFSRATSHLKGYTIYLIDKGIYATIISAKYDEKNGYINYLAVLYTGDD